VNPGSGGNQNEKRRRRETRPYIRRANCENMDSAVNVTGDKRAKCAEKEERRELIVIEMIMINRMNE